jgi:Na+-transporting methylmalonyl-CoA/oxaloacetate decarboxylase gamma subunit
MTDLTLGIQITAIGMGLVFAAILILWLMMILLTKLTADAPPGGSASDSAGSDRVAETELLARAAALGVAMAIAEQQLSSAHPLEEPPTALVSAWQLGMRTRHMTYQGRRRRQP